MPTLAPPPRIRREIQVVPPSVSNAALARRYGIHRHTVAKWRKRASTEDASARPHRLCTTLTEAQEPVVVAIRELLLLPLDDLLVVVREFIEPCLSRLALDRCLRRHGVSDLRTLQRERDGDKASPQPPKRFKAYESGFVHIDVKYLPKMQDEASRKSLFVAIDRTTRWVCLEIRKDKRAKSVQAFKRVFDLVKDFGTFQSPKSTRSSPVQPGCDSEQSAPGHATEMWPRFARGTRFAPVCISRRTCEAELFDPVAFQATHRTLGHRFGPGRPHGISSTASLR